MSHVNLNCSLKHYESLNVVGNVTKWTAANLQPTKSTKYHSVYPHYIVRASCLTKMCKTSSLKALCFPSSCQAIQCSHMLVEIAVTTINYFWLVAICQSEVNGNKTVVFSGVFLCVVIIITMAWINLRTQRLRERRKQRAQSSSPCMWLLSVT
jgi:hypothetical protein